MRKTVAELPDELCAYLQRIWYELQGYRILCARIIERGNNELYEQFMNEMLSLNAQYQTAMEELRSKYLPPEMRTSEFIFNVDFSTNELTVSEVRHAKR